MACVCHPKICLKAEREYSSVFVRVCVSLHTQTAQCTIPNITYTDHSTYFGCNENSALHSNKCTCVCGYMHCRKYLTIYTCLESSRENTKKSHIHICSNGGPMHFACMLSTSHSTAQRINGGVWTLYWTSPVVWPALANRMHFSERCTCDPWKLKSMLINRLRLSRSRHMPFTIT